MVGDAGGVAITEFQLIVAILGVAGTAFAGWLYRHERWFRDRVFPDLQVLTGKASDGSDVDPTSDGGVIGETDDRLTRLEETAEEVAENQNELQRDVTGFARTQKRHNRQTEGYLRRIAGAVDDDTISTADFFGADPYFTNHIPDSRGAPRVTAGFFDRYWFGRWTFQVVE